MTAVFLAATAFAANHDTPSLPPPDEPLQDIPQPAPPARRGAAPQEPLQEAAQPAQSPKPADAPKRKAAFAEGAGALKLIVYDAKGHPLDLKGFLNFAGRADRKDAAPENAAVVVTSPEGLGYQKARLEQKGPLITLGWEKLGRVRVGLSWPVADDGFSTVWIDHDGEGFSDGDAVYLNEEIARTQYRLFKEAWLRHTKDMDPQYTPGEKALKFSTKAKDDMAKAEAQKDGPKRAAAFDKAIYDVALSWETMLFEHGLQMAHTEKLGRSERFGLTLDASILDRLDSYPWIAEAIAKAGANWVRLVFKPNPADFQYEKSSSFAEYDAIVKELRSHGLRIMGTVLDTNQWPSKLTPAAYAERTRRLVVHYSDQIKSWEVGPEINGDWLGGSKEPMSLDQAFKVFQAGALAVKMVEPSLETVATLYWWDQTAPDENHSLFGWLTRYVPQGFGRNIDVVGLSLWPEDNPVGTAFEPIFERVRQVLPDKRIMLSSYGYVEKDNVNGYWWLHPSDVDGGRKDLVILYTGASCGMTRSVCGGFWWQTLDQMLVGRKKATDLFKRYKQTLQELGR